jgi:hypothetical protein
MSNCQADCSISWLLPFAEDIDSFLLEFWLLPAEAGLTVDVMVVGLADLVVFDSSFPPPKNPLKSPTFSKITNNIQTIVMALPIEAQGIRAFMGLLPTICISSLPLAKWYFKPAFSLVNAFN